MHSTTSNHVQTGLEPLAHARSRKQKVVMKMQLASGDIYLLRQDRSDCNEPTLIPRVNPAESAESVIYAAPLSAAPLSL